MNLTAQRLRALRKREGLSQTEVARILGITRTAYNKYESGASAPSRKLRELAQLYHVSTDYILGEEDALAEKLREAGADVMRHDTNMLFVRVGEEHATALGEYMKAQGVLINASPIVRLVMHLDVSREQLAEVVAHWRAFLTQ